MAKLYSVNVTNVLGGVASFCRRCAATGGLCAPCPPGHALDHSTGACQPCPPGTFLRGHPPDGPPACQPCGPGTRSNQVSIATCPHMPGGRGCRTPPWAPLVGGTLGSWGGHSTWLSPMGVTNSAGRSQPLTSHVGGTIF